MEQGVVSSLAMRVISSCLQCVEPETDALSPPPPFPVELSDDGLLDSKCARGHRTVFVVQSLRFELLFDFGILALQDGYFREAVTSFNAALERSYEFFMRDLAARSPALAAAFPETWKQMAAQSERQFGAFAAMYLVHTNTAWVPLAKKFVELRNDCVHKGYLPSASEATEFGVACLQAIWRIVDSLQADYSDLLRRSLEFGERHAAAREAINSGGGQLGSTSFPSVVDVMHRADNDAALVLKRAVANGHLRNLYPRGSQ